MREKWIKQVQRTRANWTCTDSSRICSEHFTDDCFDQIPALKQKVGITPTHTRVLLPNAIPTIFHRKITGTEREIPASVSGTRTTRSSSTTTCTTTTSSSQSHINKPRRTALEKLNRKRVS
jgi:hypothetical protein